MSMRNEDKLYVAFTLMNIRVQRVDSYEDRVTETVRYLTDLPTDISPGKLYRIAEKLGFKDFAADIDVERGIVSIEYMLSGTVEEPASEFMIEV